VNIIVTDFSCRYQRIGSKYPVEEWHGGQVQKIYLMRGQIHNIQGEKFSPWEEPVQLIESSHLKKLKSVVPQALLGASFLSTRHI